MSAQYMAVRHSTVQHITAQYRTVRCSASLSVAPVLRLSIAPPLHYSKSIAPVLHLSTGGWAIQLLSNIYWGGDPNRLMAPLGVGNRVNDPPGGGLVVVLCLHNTVQDTSALLNMAKSAPWGGRFLHC